MERDHTHRSMEAGHLPAVFERGDAKTLRVRNIFRRIDTAARVGGSVVVVVDDHLGTEPVTFALLDRLTFRPF